MNKRKLNLLLFTVIVIFCNLSISHGLDLSNSGWSKIHKSFRYESKRTVTEFPSDLPYSAVAFVDAGYGVCSGFMIGPHYAVTAANCIYSKFTGFADKVLVVPGSFGQNAKCGPSYANHMYIMDTDLRDEYDVAVLHFNEELGNCSGWFGYKQITSSDAYNQVKIIGYNPSQMQYETTGYLQGFNDNKNFIQHKMDTKNEPPGAPILFNDKYVVGIDLFFDNSYNLGLRFTDEVVKFLEPYWGK